MTLPLEDYFTGLTGSSTLLVPGFETTICFIGYIRFYLDGEFIHELYATDRLQMLGQGHKFTEFVVNSLQGNYICLEPFASAEFYQRKLENQEIMDLYQHSLTMFEESKCK